MKKYRPPKIGLKKEKKKSIAFWLGAIIFSFLILLFTDLGLVKWYQLRNRKQMIESEVEQLKDSIGYYTDKRDLLENDMEYVLQEAKARYSMVKPGEKVFQVIDNREKKEKE